MKTIAIDFDGVIHAYTKGWQDGKIYDPPLDGAIPMINRLMGEGYGIFILSTRSSRQIKAWVRAHSNPLLYMSQADFYDQYMPMMDADEKWIKEEYSNMENFQFRVERIYPWTKFWNKKGVIGVTKRKLAAHVYLDDRALLFEGNWEPIANYIEGFKTWQGK